MKRIILVAAIAACLVYPVYAAAQPAPMSAPVPARMSAPAPVRPVPVMAVVKAPKVPEMAVMAPAMQPAVAVVPVMASAAPVMAPVAMEAPMAAMDAPVAMAAPEQPSVAAAKPKESGLDKANKWIGLITKMLTGLLLIIGAILGAVKGVEWRQALKSGRWAKILEYARKYAFPAVEAIAKSTAWKGDDKLAEFIKRMDDWLEGEGDKPLSALEVKNLNCEAADMAAADKADDDRKVDAEAVTRRKIA